ncbi:MAG: GTP-dependent dephospho-CoA kinase family protein [Zestosphaera sp.]
MSRGTEEVVVGEDPIQTMKKALENLRECLKLVAVGDLVCYTIIENSKTPDVCVVDGKTRRTNKTPEIREERFDKTARTWNPPGHITQDALNTIREAVEALNKNQKTLIKVLGEEDLLALPLITQLPEGSCVVLGIPNVGVGYVRVNQEARKKAEEILSRFYEVEISPY